MNAVTLHDGALVVFSGKKLFDLLLAETHTCYLGDRAHRHAPCL